MPKNFRIFDIEDMNSHKGVKSILKFCGIPEEEMEIAEVCGTHINKTADSHIEIVKDFKEQFGEDF